jgi:hypothetical protein
MGSEQVHRDARDMQDPTTAVQVRASHLAAPAIAVGSGRHGIVRPFLDALSALAAVLFLMSAADLDTPVPYLCGAAALLAALGAGLAR